MQTPSQEEEYGVNCFATKSDHGREREGKTLSFVFSLQTHRCGDQSAQPVMRAAARERTVPSVCALVPGRALLPREHA